MPQSENNFSCAEFETRLTGYLEGDMQSAEADLMHTHVAECGACGALVRDLRVISNQAAALPLLSPSRDLWSGIESRLDSPVTSLTERSTRVNTRRTSPTFSTRLLAAAALLLVTVSSGATFLAMRSVNRPANGVQLPSSDFSSFADSNSRTQFASYGAESLDRIYEREIGALRTVVDQRLGELDPKTVAVIRRNIEIIDKAIADSRNALIADPHSGFLSSQLNRTLEMKLSTLRKVALL